MSHQSLSSLSSESSLRSPTNISLLSSGSSPKSPATPLPVQTNTPRSELEATFFSYISSENIDACISYVTTPAYKTWLFRDEDNYSALHHSTYINDFNFTCTIISETKANASNSEFEDLINARSSKGFTALHYAVYRGNIKTIKLLLDNGADLFCRNNTGLTLLHMAAQGNKVNSMYFLMKEYGLDIMTLDYNANTALHWACYFNSDKIVKYIMLSVPNININSQNNDRYTPLHLAVLSGGFKNIKRLLLKGANVTLKSNKNQTAIDLANNMNNQKIIQLLKNKSIEPIVYSSCNLISFYALHLLFPLVVIGIAIPYIKSNTILFNYSIWTLFVDVILIINKIVDSGVVINPNPKFSLIKEIENVDIDKYCPVCECKLTRTSTHCFICNKCVDEYDHHCIWMNKCVGRGNKNLFYFTMLLILVNLIIVNYICICAEMSKEIGDFKGIYKYIEIYILKHILCFVAFVLCIFGVVIVGPLLTFYLRHHCKDKSARVMSQRIENVDDLDMNKIEFSENLIHGKRMNKQMSIANPNMKGKPKKENDTYLNINEKV